MKKLLKWILILIACLVVLLLIAAIALPLVLDPNNFKEEISVAVREETGRDLTIGGDIKWTVFPWIGFEISDLKLSNRPGYGDQPMVEVGQAGASVKFAPLLSRRVELGSITLADMSVYLHQRADGSNNWEDLSSGETQTTASDTGQQQGLESLSVSSLTIENTNVIWDDAGSTTELRELGLAATNIELGKPFDLDGAFAVLLSESGVEGEVNFGGKVSSKADGSRYGIEGLTLEFQGTQKTDSQPIPLAVAVSADADVDLTEDTASLTDFALTFHDLSVDGQLDVSSLTGEPQFQGALTLNEFSPKNLLDTLGMPLETTEPNALTSMRAKMNFSGSTAHANMDNLTLSFDQSTFQGYLRIAGFSEPRLDFDFEIDEINVDSYMPTTPAEATESEDLSVELFRGFSGGGDFRVGKLVVGGMTISNASLTMSSQGKGFRLFPIGADLYGGKLQGDIRINAAGQRPILLAKQSLSGVQAQGLLQDLVGSARLEGVGDFNMDIRTDLTNDKSIKRRLDGSFGMTFLDGAIVGINVAESIRSAQSLLGNAESNAEDTETERDPKTDFSELSVSGQFDKGTLTSDDLLMKSPLLRVTGKGALSLVEESINFQVKPVIVSSLEGQGGQGLDELGGIPIPVNISGNLYAPDVGVDIVGALAESQKARIDEKKDELKDKLLGKLLGGDDDESAADGDGSGEEEEKSEDPAETLLKGLFGKRKKDDDDDSGNR